MTECKYCKSYILTKKKMERHYKSKKCKGIRENLIREKKIEETETQLKKKIKKAKLSFPLHEKIINDFLDNLINETKYTNKLISIMAKKQGIFIDENPSIKKIPTFECDLSEFESMIQTVSHNKIDKDDKIEFIDKNSEILKKNKDKNEN